MRSFQKRRYTWDGSAAYAAAESFESEEEMLDEKRIAGARRGDETERGCLSVRERKSGGGGGGRGGRSSSLPTLRSHARSTDGRGERGHGIGT